MKDWRVRCRTVSRNSNGVEWGAGKCARARCGWSVFGMIKWTFCSILTCQCTTCLGQLDDEHEHRGDDLPHSLNHLLMVIASVFLLLYVIGVVKAIIGMRFPTVGLWGLSALIVLPRSMASYHEPHLRHQRVEHDEHGYPVHPDTGKRTVRLISRYSEFCLNSVLFLVLPCAVLCTLFCRVLCFWRRCALQVNRCPSCAKNCTRWPLDHADKDRLLPGLVGSSDCCACDDHAEELDARYVALQLQKSRDSLAKSQCSKWKMGAGRGRSSSSSAELYLYQPKVKRPQDKDMEKE